MLSKEVFNKGITDIKEMFTGFEITKKRAEVWYEYSKDLTNDKFLYRISNCIKGCRKIPTLADILDWKNYYVNEKEEADLRSKREEIENELQRKKEIKYREETNYSTIPEEARKIMAKINNKYKDKLDKLNKEHKEGK